VRSSLCKKIFSCYETQQLILGTGTAIWWVTEPHLQSILEMPSSVSKLGFNWAISPTRWRYQSQV
jgi:hypothetical protein